MSSPEEACFRSDLLARLKARAQGVPGQVKPVLKWLELKTESRPGPSSRQQALWGHGHTYKPPTYRRSNFPPMVERLPRLCVGDEAWDCCIDCCRQGTGWDWALWVMRNCVDAADQGRTFALHMSGCRSWAQIESGARPTLRIMPPGQEM